MPQPKIVTYYDPKPIPLRQFDWIAVTDNYDAYGPIGYGRTEREAIDDLREMLDELEDDEPQPETFTG